MYTEQTKKILKQTGSLIENDHIVLRSGLHTATYINHDPLFEQPAELTRITRMLATICTDLRVEVVVGPETGGRTIAEWVARHLCEIEKRVVYDAFASKRTNKSFKLTSENKRMVRGQRCLIVDDVATTRHGTAWTTARLVEYNNGIIVGAAVVWNRGGITKQDLNVPVLLSLVVEDIKSYQPGPKHCPMCKKGQFINETVGHPHLWLDKMIVGK